MSQALAALTLGAAGSAEHGTKLPMQPAMFALIAIITFIALLGLTWVFRGSSNKHH